MKVIKTETTLIIKLEDEKTIYDIITAENLFWNDLTFYESNQDGWSYFYDANRNMVIMLDDYGFNLLKELLDKKEIELTYIENGEDYKCYEWNEGD